METGERHLTWQASELHIDEMTTVILPRLVGQARKVLPQGAEEAFSV